MFDKSIFKINKFELYNNISFNILKYNHIIILKYLVNNLDIEFEMIENYLFSHYFIIRFKSNILKESVQVKYNYSFYKNFDEEYNIDSIMLIINNSLRYIDFNIIQKKRFGIIPITELPNKFYHKFLNIHV